MLREKKTHSSYISEESQSHASTVAQKIPKQFSRRASQHITDPVRGKQQFVLSPLVLLFQMQGLMILTETCLQDWRHLAADLVSRFPFPLLILNRRIPLQSVWLGDMLQVPVSTAGLDRQGRGQETLRRGCTLNLPVLKSTLSISLLCVLQKPRTPSVA